MLVDALLISEEFVQSENGFSKISKYLLTDGTEVIDTFTVTHAALRSLDGTDTATRTRTVGKLGSIKLTASFKWYTEGLFSYVKCTSASATASPATNCKADVGTVNKTDDYVSIGAAHASVSFSFYSLATGGLGSMDGTLKITCTDDGTISDNG